MTNRFEKVGRAFEKSAEMPEIQYREFYEAKIAREFSPLFRERVIAERGKIMQEIAETGMPNKLGTGEIITKAVERLEQEINQLSPQLDSAVRKDIERGVEREVAEKIKQLRAAKEILKEVTEFKESLQ